MFLHSVASWTVTIIVTTDEVVAAVILEFLLDGQVIKLSSEGKLPINLLLGDVEVLHIEETLRKVRLFCFVERAPVWLCVK